MKIQRLDHVAIISENSLESRKWYERIFEMEWICQGQWDDNPFFLKKGDALIAIFQKGTATSGLQANASGIDHFAFRAETWEDYEAIKRELESKGIEFNEQNHEISFSIYLKDPDGVKVEVTTYDVG
jgi:catechol-2,3-dioxygenase